MKIIALLTDFGYKDNFVGVMKGVILSINPQVNLVDISHGARPQSILEAHFLLKNSYNFFPKGTIFVGVVDPGVGSKRKPILIETNDYFFIGPDNGIFSFLESYEIKNTVHLTNKEYFLKPVSSTFHGRDIFAPVAGFVSRGVISEEFGTLIKSIKRIEIPKPRIKKGKLVGEIIYIDGFGNLISNISREIFDKFTKGSKFEIAIGKVRINKISSSYAEANSKTPIALFNSFQNLEISMKDDSCAENLGLNPGERIRIGRVAKPIH
jgi:S-adenosylmethionine hydrolase